MGWLEAIRKNRSQADVAKNAGISQAFYCEIERGKKCPSVPVAKKIAAVLGFDWTKFYE